MTTTQIGNTYGFVSATPGMSTAKVIRFTQGATGGNNFQLQVGSVLTANIARLATATALRDALRAIPAIGPTGCNSSGGPLGTSPVDITLAGKLEAIDLKLPVFVNVDLTGGVVAIAQQVALVTTGYTNDNFQSIDKMRAFLSLAGFSAGTLDKMSYNDLLFAARQLGAPWTIF